MRGGAKVVKVDGKLVAVFGKGVLDGAGGLVAVEPAGAIVVEFPAGGQRRHDVYVLVFVPVVSIGGVCMSD